MPTVLIIGGGVAGTAAALALDKAAYDVTVYEAHPVNSHDRGAFLTLASNGMHALRQIDADTAVCATSAPLRTMRVCADEGQEIATVALGDSHEPVTEYRYLTRAELCSALQRQAQDRGIRIERDKRLTQISTNSGAVTAMFSDGSRACGDVLIGADGLRSVVRTVLNRTASVPRYAGERVFYGYSTNTGVDSPPDHFQVIRGSAAFGYIVTKQHDTWWFCRVNDTELSHYQLTTGTTASWKAELSTHLRDDQTPAAAIVRAAHQVMVTNAYDLPTCASGTGITRCSLVTPPTPLPPQPGKAPPWRWKMRSSRPRYCAIVLIPRAHSSCTNDYAATAYRPTSTTAPT
jgi:2-polyprenyl-6-methoxyphenol hydroxylase-like FAD-dependent oxidoreductase